MHRAIIAFYAAWTVYLVIEEPQRIPFVSHLVALGAKDLQAARGTVDGRAFEIALGEPVYWLLVVLAGVLLLSVVAGVAKALISAGVSLLGPVLKKTA